MKLNEMDDFESEFRAGGDDRRDAQHRPGKGRGYRDTEAFLVDLMTQLRTVQRDLSTHELSAEEAIREYDRVIRSFDDAQVRPRR